MFRHFIRRIPKTGQISNRPFPRKTALFNNSRNILVKKDFEYIHFLHFLIVITLIKYPYYITDTRNSISYSKLQFF